MSSNWRSFDIGLKSFSRKTVPASVRAFRNAIALEGLRGVVLLTPVRTGRAKGNWQTTAEKPAEGFFEDRFDKNGSATITAGNEVIRKTEKPYASIWIHNGVPYIVFINDGTPKVAAVHMLEQTAERLRRWGRELRLPKTKHESVTNTARGRVLERDATGRFLPRGA